MNTRRVRKGRCPNQCGAKRQAEALLWEAVPQIPDDTIDRFFFAHPAEGHGAGTSAVRSRTGDPTVDA